MSADTHELLPERDGVAAPPQLAERRAGMNAARDSGVWDTDPPPPEIEAGGIRALRFVHKSTPRATLLHIHGGGFRIGCPEVVGPFAAALAERCELEVICPAYRLAPEHPFPSGLNDCWQVLTALNERAAGPIILSGDSAGGALAAGLTAMACRRNLAIRALILLSPWLDLTNSNASFKANRERDKIFSKADAAAAAAGYLQGHPAHDPLASPALCDLSGFPATFLNAGTGEVLVDDAVHFSARLSSAGIAVTCDLVPDMEHVAVTRNFAMAGASQTFAKLTDFIDAVLTPQ